jgi:hypothetical protein
MPILPEIDTPFLLDFLSKQLNPPSPTGLAEPAIALGLLGRAAACRIRSQIETG